MRKKRAAALALAASCLLLGLSGCGSPEPKGPELFGRVIGAIPGAAIQGCEKFAAILILRLDTSAPYSETASYTILAVDDPWMERFLMQFDRGPWSPVLAVRPVEVAPDPAPEVAGRRCWYEWKVSSARLAGW